MATEQDHQPMLISAQFGFADDVFRLFVSQLLCYLLAIVYNLLIVKQSVEIKHIWSFTCGLLICYYNFGIDAGHSLVTIGVSWSIMKVLGPSRSMVGLNFAFVTSYLLYGYWMKETANSPFTWTLPQCVLTLSLIAQAWDIYDGHENVLAKEKDEKGALVNEDTALETMPSLLETLSKTYFPPTVLIGPQVRFKDYLIFTENTENLVPACWKQSLVRFVLGVIYFGVYQTGLKYLPASYFPSDAFKAYGLVAKLFLLAFHNKVVLCKYLAGWIISEGSCIMYGISRDPVSKQINRCFNINVLQYETTATFGGLIESFNMTTNYFAFRYIFKRLRFLKSKLLSQFGTLLFLAVWHGFSLGYYNTFAMEMVMMKMEKDLATIIVKCRTRNQQLNQLLNNSYIRCLVYLLMRLHIVLMFSYAFTSFGFLEYTKWTAVLGELHWIGHFIYFPWLLVAVPLSL